MHPSFIIMSIFPFFVSSIASFPLSMKSSVYIATSLDGFIAAPDGSINFLTEFQETATEQDGDMGFSSFLATVDLIVMGRKTWDQVVSFGEGVWPYGEREVWVWSQTPDEVKIPKCHSERVCAYSLSPTNMMKMARERDYTHVYIDGGATIREFHRYGLIDEYILSRLPVVLGGGIPLFGNENCGKSIKLVHLGTRSFSNGIVQSHYQVQIL